MTPTAHEKIKLKKKNKDRVDEEREGDRAGKRRGEHRKGMEGGGTVSATFQILQNSKSFLLAVASTEVILFDEERRGKETERL